MTVYPMVNRWEIPARRDDVWQVLNAGENYPTWWPAFKDAVLLDEGGADGTGRRVRVRARSRLPYQLEYELTARVVRPPDLIVIDAEGDLTGTGRLELDDDGDLTVVTLDWRVAATRWFMRLLEPLLRPVYLWNHNQMMRQGAVALAHHLGVPMATHRTIEPTPRIVDWAPLAGIAIALCAAARWATRQSRKLS